MRVRRWGIFFAVIDFPLASFTSLHGIFHSTGFAIATDSAVALVVVFWLGLAYWVHRDARRRIRDPFLRFFANLLGLVPPFIGPVVYRLFRPAETLHDVRARRAELQALEQHLARAQPAACPVCSSSVELDWVACPVCTTMLRQPCAHCNAPLEPLWQICPYCTTPIAPAQVDLDAALMAETKTISLVDDTIPLVPQTEQRAADAQAKREGAVSRALVSGLPLGD